jgi:hypothetical protein
VFLTVSDSLQPFFVSSQVPFKDTKSSRKVVRKDSDSDSSSSSSEID